MFKIPDHPDIERALRTGYPYGVQEEDEYEDEDEYIDDEYEEDEYDEEEAYADYCDMLNDLAREERIFGDYF